MTAAAATIGPGAPMKSAFAMSLALHVTVMGALLALAWWNPGSDPFGDNKGGAAVAVSIVDRIPLPSKGPENPVANDSDSEVPQTPPEKPAPKAKEREPEPPDAVAILPPEKRNKLPSMPKLQSFKDLAQNQLKSTTPQQVSNPLFGPKGGVGGEATFGDSTLGSRFPEYAANVIDIAQRSWRTNDVDRSVTKAPPVTVTFTLLKDGRVEGVRLTRSSGVPSLDLSVRRAIEEAHFPPLPVGYEKTSVPVNLTFELAR